MKRLLPMPCKYLLAIISLLLCPELLLCQDSKTDSIQDEHIRIVWSKYTKNGVNPDNVVRNKYSHVKSFHTHLDMPVFVVDTINIKEPCIFTSEKNGNAFIIDMAYATGNNLKPIKKSSERSLLSNGCAILLTCNAESLLSRLRYNELIKTLLNKLICTDCNNFIGLSLNTNKALKGYDVQTFSLVPYIYLLFMVKGDYYNHVIANQYNIAQIDFDNKRAYYPLVIPLYLEDMRLMLEKDCIEFDK